MTQDGADTSSIEERLREATRELAELDAQNATLMEAVPFGVAILYPDGTSDVNPVGSAIFGETPEDAPPDEWQQTYRFFRPDKTTPIPITELSGVRAMGGVATPSERMWVLQPDGMNAVMVDVAATPLPGYASVSVIRDVTARARLERELEDRRATLEERDAQNHALIERLRVALDALATPVLEVDEGVLVVPVVGLVDTQRAAQIAEHLLHEVVRQQASYVVIDATGVEVVDTATAVALARIVSAVELLGARCVASGLSATVVQTLVELGVDLARLETHRSLRQALERTVEARARGRVSRSGRMEAAR